MDREDLVLSLPSHLKRKKEISKVFPDISEAGLSAIGAFPA